MARDSDAGLVVPVTVDLSGDLALRAYPDRRPGNLEIAGIHKALILIRGHVELVEEGAGFGLPIAIFSDKTLFPGSASMKTIQMKPYPIIEKTYEMDTISVKSLGGTRVSDALYHPAHRVFSALYLSLGGLKPAFDKVMELRDAAGVRTSFRVTEPRGRVNVRYMIRPDAVEVEAKSELDEGCEELIMLNEQGASTFRVCREASLTLIDDEIGAWGRMDAGEATLSTLDGGLSFSVVRPMGAGFWRGRERVRGRLSWAGLSLTFGARDSVKYTIRVDQQRPTA
jgi:hypothetical protein